MSDNQGSEQPATPSTNPENDWVVWAIQYLKRKFEKRRANKKKETSQDRAARRTADATVWIAVFTVVTALVGSFTYFAIKGQLYVMQQQLDEMKSGSVQNDKLITANGKLADAAQKSADTADKSMIASQRAWVGSVDATVIKGEPGTPIKGTVTYINSGKEPAKFMAEANTFSYATAQWMDGTASEEIADRQETCLSKNEISGFRFAWPTTGFSQYFLHFPIDEDDKFNVIWSDEIGSGNKIFVIQGCFTYEAFRQIRHTSFCYFYNGKTSDIMHLNICNFGNDVN